MSVFNNVLFDPKDKMPLYQQIAKSIGKQIDKGTLLRDTKLPSINQFSKTYVVARDTIEQAYKLLKQKGYIVSESGKGYYVAGKLDKKIRILLIFNKLSSYKKNIYYSFLKTLGNKAKVDLQIHHYNPLLLKEIIQANAGKYHYYVIMPHFTMSASKKECLDILRMIPENELVLLDKLVPELTGGMSVYQDFRNDIYQALLSASESIEKYQQIAIVFPDFTDHPTEIKDGINQFCQEQHKKFTIISDSNLIRLVKGTVYIVLYENDLAVLIKTIRDSKFKMGSEVGIISFNETIFKELLDITVITTDFEQMGITAANMILKNQRLQIKNPFKIIKRGSL